MSDVIYSQVARASIARRLDGAEWLNSSQNLCICRILRSSEDAHGSEAGLPSSTNVGVLPPLSSANILASTTGLMGPPDPPVRTNSAKLAAHEAVSPKAGALMERFGSGLLAADIARGPSEERSLSPLARQGSGTGTMPTSWSALQSS